MGYLTLTRKVGEAIELKTELREIIIIKLDSAHEGRARISIDAPSTVEILRTELKTRKDSDYERFV